MPWPSAHNTTCWTKKEGKFSTKLGIRWELLWTARIFLHSLGAQRVIFLGKEKYWAVSFSTHLHADATREQPMDGMRVCEKTFGAQVWNEITSSSRKPHQEVFGFGVCFGCEPLAVSVWLMFRFWCSVQINSGGVGLLSYSATRGQIAKAIKFFICLLGCWLLGYCFSRSLIEYKFTQLTGLCGCAPLGG